MVGPWLGDDELEHKWIEFVKKQVAMTPVDTVIIGCKTHHESLYDCINPDMVLASIPKGVIDKHLVDGNVPSFDITNPKGKELLLLRPMTHIMKAIASEYYE